MSRGWTPAPGQGLRGEPGQGPDVRGKHRGPTQKQPGAGQEPRPPAPQNRCTHPPAPSCLDSNTGLPTQPWPHGQPPPPMEAVLPHPKWPHWVLTTVRFLPPPGPMPELACWHPLPNSQDTRPCSPPILVPRASTAHAQPVAKTPSHTEPEKQAHFPPGDGGSRDRGRSSFAEPPAAGHWPQTQALPRAPGPSRVTHPCQPAVTGLGTSPRDSVGIREGHTL